MRQETWQKYSEWPLVGAAFVFLAAYSILVIAEPPQPYADLLEIVVGSTWVAFGADYIVKLLLAPHRGRWFVRHPLDLLMVVLPVRPVIRLVRRAGVPDNAERASLHTNRRLPRPSSRDRYQR